jgi:hypothetical protein
MTRKRYLTVAALFGVMCCAGIAAVWVIDANSPAGPGVTKANYDRIEKGMTKEDVRAILGGKGESHFLLFAGGTLHTWITSTSWTGEDGSVAEMHFVESGDGPARVTATNWIESKETITERLLRVLRLRKK